MQINFLIAFTYQCGKTHSIEGKVLDTIVTTAADLISCKNVLWPAKKHDDITSLQILYDRTVSKH